MHPFDLKAPAPGKPRLRFAGDRTVPTWRARMEGAKYLAAEHEALEYLTVLSVVARWVEECEVETAT